MDARRKRRQAQHPGLTLTEMYDVPGEFRAGESFSGWEKGRREELFFPSPLLCPPLYF